MKYQELDGTLQEKECFQDKFLRKLYTTIQGRMAIKILIQPAVSKMCGRLLNSRISALMIPAFIRKNEIDMSLYEEKRYGSYNEFFIRKIKEGKRTFDENEEVLVSPCDGKVSAYRLDETSSFMVKGSVYSVDQLLKSSSLAKRFLGGCAVVIRLSVEDYHHYCYPASGYKSRNYYIPGKFHTVNPIAVETVPVYKENTREYCLLKTRQFGTILQMEVGALLVGKICNDRESAKVRKGEEKGHFEFGGSTIILLIQKEKIKLREEFFLNTERGIETKVQMGQKLGKVFKRKDGK